LERVSIISALKQIKFLLFALILIDAGCSLEKQSGFNRSMQNLTAHYNILFNAKEILRQKQESYATSFIDNYNEVLTVYQDTTAKTTTTDKDLDAAMAKANTIINVKEQSHYLGDAYLILGKVNYLNADYYNAVEYFSYVTRSFPQRLDLKQEALVWKARSLMYLGQLPQAKLVLDSAEKTINPKKHIPADIYAAKLQYDIDIQDWVDGEEMATKAVHYCRNKMQRLRWTFILAQLQELNQKPTDAFKNYGQLVKSNVSFEMAFNASLNQIRIEDSRNGVKISRIDRLKDLLKNPNNNDFKDQIYYQIAQLQLADKDIDWAVKNYQLSVRYSVKNQNQKGLSYLRLAEINFKTKGDYLNAKKYYDSTLTSLPANYPGYQSIQKLSNNLQLLADRLQIIAREDTLQSLAKMDEKTRDAAIDKMVSDRILQQRAVAIAAANNAGSYSPGPQQVSSGGNSSFYFYNSSAVSQGYTDFKRKWGNRKLEDNWRRSDRSNSDITNNTSIAGQGSDPDAPPVQSQTSKVVNTAGNYRQELLKGLPTTPALLAQSNNKIYNAYIDIGNFYRDILADKKEAIAIYELILKRFPDDPNKPAIYYSLYRLYSDVDAAKSDQYKNRLLKDYPDTPFAKVISDPDFARKLNDKDAAATEVYNKAFDLYAHKKYKDVTTIVPELLKQNPDGKYASQLFYLKTIAEGHAESVTPFRDSLEYILKKFPNDRLIVPLVTQHLAYIKANQAELLTRKVVLADEDPREVPFTLTPELKEETAFRRPVMPGAYLPVAATTVPDKQQPSAAAPKPEPTKPTEATQPVVKPADSVNTKIAAKPVEKLPDSPIAPGKPVVKAPDNTNSIFSMRDSTNYYFVVSVSSGTSNLSSSRFGIGQFNRANYPGNGIRHQLLNVGADNQLIYVGRFLTLDGVKKYARAIIPLMPDIMKVPADKYSFFIITKENLDKLADKKALDSYMDFYQKNY